MNKKGIGVSDVVKWTLAILVLVVLIYILLNGLANPFSKTIACPLEKERCLAKSDGCSGSEGFIEATTKKCSQKDTICCMTPEEISGLKEVKSFKEETGNGANGGAGTNTGNSISTGSGRSTIEVRDGPLDAFDPTILQPKTTRAIASGTSLKLVTWVSKGQDICSINLRNITGTTNELIHPDWFSGEITRQNCNSTNKKGIIITPPASVAGQKFKLDIMTFNDVDLKTDILDSSTIYVNVNLLVAGTSTTLTSAEEETQCQNPSIIPLEQDLPSCVDGANIVSFGANLDLTQPIVRTSGMPRDDFKISTNFVERAKCTVKLYDMTVGGTGVEFYPTKCVSGFVTSPQDCYSNSKILTMYYDGTSSLNCTKDYLKKDMQLRVNVYSKDGRVIDTQSLSIKLN